MEFRNAYFYFHLHFINCLGKCIFITRELLKITLVGTMGDKRHVVVCKKKNSFMPGTTLRACHLFSPSVLIETL